MGELSAQTKFGVSSIVRILGGTFILGLWLSAVASSASRFEDVWAPPPPDVPAPAAEPNEPDQDPKPSSLDDSTEPTPV